MVDKPKYHRRRSPRLAGFDYSSSGAYLVTVCAHGGKHWFDNERARSVVENCWFRIPDVFKGVFLDSFVITPNHFHDIIGITYAQAVASNVSSKTVMKNSNPSTGSVRLSTVIGVFKSVVTRRLRQMGYHSFRWQRCFYDRIVRNDTALRALRNYIAGNPRNWAYDPENLAFNGRPGGSPLPEL
jgi:putative transposase